MFIQKIAIGLFHSLVHRFQKEGEKNYFSKKGYQPCRYRIDPIGRMLVEGLAIINQLIDNLNIAKSQKVRRCCLNDQDRQLADSNDERDRQDQGDGTLTEAPAPDWHRDQQDKCSSMKQERSEEPFPATAKLRLPKSNKK